MENNTDQDSVCDFSSLSKATGINRNRVLRAATQLLLEDSASGDDGMNDRLHYSCVYLGFTGGMTAAAGQSLRTGFFKADVVILKSIFEPKRKCCKQWGWLENAVTV